MDLTTFIEHSYYNTVNLIQLHRIVCLIHNQYYYYYYYYVMPHYHLHLIPIKYYNTGTMKSVVYY